MKPIDEAFLAEVGLAAMPEQKKQEFLAFVQEELEVRIGERIAKGLPETKLNEFEQEAFAHLNFVMK